MLKPSNDQKIGDVLSSYLKDNKKLKPRLDQKKLMQIWEEEMGPTIAGYTRDIRLYRHKVFITIDSAPLRNELSYSKEKICRFLNESLGEDLIDAVVIR